jgi:epoxyqueuosine reductase
MAKSLIERLAAECGFELAGVAPVGPAPGFSHFMDWVRRGFAGSMTYLSDHRAFLRQDARSLLPSAESVICVGKLYNTGEPYSTSFQQPGRAWVSRYAWGEDYHDVMRAGLDRLAARLREELGRDFEYRVCVDTAPVLERALAREAGLGWIGRNTCLINQRQGSWFFLGELLVSLPLEPATPPPDRCGTCRRCIEACPTAALVERDGRWELDAGRCISYLTIELRDEIPEEFHESMGRHVFGCDICQDVCPWNRNAPVTAEPAFQAKTFAPPLEELAGLREETFRERFRRTPLWRARFQGFMRNVAVALRNGYDGDSGAGSTRRTARLRASPTGSSRV